MSGMNPNREDPKPALILLAVVIGALVLFAVAVHAFLLYLGRGA
jgi:hypothetical protein